MPISVIVWASVLLAGISVWHLVSVWFQLRGQRVVKCPDNQQQVVVSLNARHAASTSFLRAPDLRLGECTRWPEKAECGQQCLSQIREAGTDCLVRNILAAWYHAKDCALCGQPIGNIDWTGSHPALLLGDQVSVEWEQVPADKLSVTLAGAMPCCFACHMANRFVREHPELVTDRHRASLSI